MDVLYSEEDIRIKVKELAAEITKDAIGNVSVVCILKGAFVFCADLIRELYEQHIPVRVDFIRAASYEGSESTGKVTFDRAFKPAKNILIVEDIVDTGLTLAELKKHLLANGAEQVKICALLDKPSRRRVDVHIDYLGFSIPDRFVVGYGMDHDENYRSLPYVATIDPLDE